MSSVLCGGRCECFCLRINQEAREGGVPPLVAVDSVALILLAVQPHAVALVESQQQALTLHLPSLRRVLVKHHRLHLALPGHQLHRNSLAGMLPHSEGEEVRAGEVAREHARGFVEVAPNVDVLHIKGQRELALLPAALTHECGCPSHRESRPRLTSGPGVSLRRAAWVGQAWGQVVGDVGVRGDVRIDEVTREADVRASIAVHSILGTLLQKQPHGVHLLQADHHTLALDFPPFLAVVIVGYGLHLLSILHQNHREHFLWKFPH